MGSLYELKIKKQKKYYPGGLPNFKNFEIGDKVKIITPSEDFHFFNEETGVVIKNSHSYLGITVKFDKPRYFKNGYIQTEFNFNPESLFKINHEYKIKQKAIFDYFAENHNIILTHTDIDGIESLFNNLNGG